MTTFLLVTQSDGSRIGQPVESMEDVANFLELLRFSPKDFSDAEYRVVIGDAPIGTLLDREAS